MWHIDGYDKLKPYGFCVHGAIDGFSRRIMWIMYLTDVPPICLTQSWKYVAMTLGSLFRMTNLNPHNPTAKAVYCTMYIEAIGL